MARGIYTCPPSWTRWLPPGVCQADAAALARTHWTLLTLTPAGAARLPEGVSCRILLLPGTCGAVAAAGSVITYGLSHRDSLTLSSLTQPVLCVQRALPRPDGGMVEPQEFPLPPLPFPAEVLLPLLGLRLLLLPAGESGFPWPAGKTAGK